jgi:xanthine dehydrogenase accessory factor
VKHWAETRQVFEWLSTLAAEQRRGALATVVRVRGSAYRREGAKMAVADDGASVGNVSGGCLEGDVREAALQVIARGAAQLRTYSSGNDQIHAWDLGVGCEGEVAIYIEPAPVMSMTEDWLLRAAEPFAVCRALPVAPDPVNWRRLVVTAIGRDGTLGDPALDVAAADAAGTLLLSRASSQMVELDGRGIFVELFHPPPQLLIVSAGNDARPLARMATDAGFRVVVADHRPALLLPDRFPAETRLVECGPTDLARRVILDDNTYTVIMTHNFADDEQYLRALLPTPVAYIGILGPRQRTERILRNVHAEQSFDDSRVYGPVGLDVGTDGAEQVSLAIVAEILAVRGGRHPASLRERQVAIHADRS